MKGNMDGNTEEKVQMRSLLNGVVGELKSSAEVWLDQAVREAKPPPKPKKKKKTAAQPATAAPPATAPLPATAPTAKVAATPKLEDTIPEVSAARTKPGGDDDNDKNRRINLDYFNVLVPTMKKKSILQKVRVHVIQEKKLPMHHQGDTANRY